MTSDVNTAPFNIPSQYHSLFTINNTLIPFTSPLTLPLSFPPLTQSLTHSPNHPPTLSTLPLTHSPPTLLPSLHHSPPPTHPPPGEKRLDAPLLYEAGWGKKLTHVLSFSRHGCVDASPRYSRKLQEVILRRSRYWYWYCIRIL